MSRPIAGTLAQTYLHSRGMVTVFDGDPPRFLPALLQFELSCRRERIDGNSA
jgi:hypothetical protein